MYAQRARQLGVSIRPAEHPKKKFDVFRDGRKITSIGAAGYKDYPAYLKEDKALAEERRRLYHLRHKPGKVGSAGYYASRILW